jgi:[ribosomal protein S5]-alanine N-acetyltransferase
VAPTRIIRPIEVDDAARFLELFARNRDFMRPFDPDRPRSFFTLEVQRERARVAQEKAAADQMWRYVILADDGAVVGTISLENIIRGPAQAADVGYWVDREHNGRGLATRALEALLSEAFGRHGLHRLGASVLPDNLASRRVLERNAFEVIGLARSYLHIGGAWRDHLLYQRLADTSP